MIDVKKSVWCAVALVAGLQLAVLATMVWGRVHLLTSGREVTVDVVPVDPRDIFRGDYVVLSYPFSRTSLNEGPEKWSLPEGAHQFSAVYVTLAPEGEAGWKRVAVGLDRPAAVDPGHVVLKGRVSQTWAGETGQGQQGHLKFGIESYFVPEGTGIELEKLVRDKKIRAVLAVGSDGTAALKALEVEGKRIHEQAPL